MSLKWMNFMNRFWRMNSPKPVDERVRAMVKLCMGRVLDVGCGKGQYFPLLGDCVGVDYSIEGLKVAEGDRVLASASYLPFKEDCFDSVYCSEVLEHVIDDVKTVGEMKRVLKDKGVLVASTPNSVVRKKYWDQWPPSKSDKREYSPESLSKLLGNATFHNYRRGDPAQEVWLVASVKVNKNVD